MFSQFDKIQKFFTLEISRGFDNKAVVGGLDKMIPFWEQIAHQQNVNADLIQSFIQKVNEYQNLSPDQRKSAIDELNQILETCKTFELQKSPSLENDAKISQLQKPQPFPASSRKPAQPAAPQKTSAGTNQNQSLGIDAPLTVIQGVGPANANKLQSLGLEKLEDLLYYFPRRYDDYSKLKPINHIMYGDELTVIGVIQHIEERPIRGGQRKIIEATLTDGTGYIRLTWFNKSYLVSSFPPESQVVVSGKVGQYLGRLVISNPEIERIEKEHLHTNRIVPIYALNSQNSQRTLRNLMYRTVMFWSSKVVDHLPQTIREESGLVDLPQALQHIHFPENADKLKSARDRLAFDEIFMLQLGVLQQKHNWQSSKAEPFSVSDDWLMTKAENLPFKLTNAQKKVIEDIRQDLSSGKPMNRLVQGDVGSGKTIIAALGIAIVSSQKEGQSAFMAPTSILAEQHYSNLLRLFTENSFSDLNLFKPEEIRLLIGSTSDSDRKEILEGLADGKIKIIIGTHALIEDPVIFNKLSLAVVDEQHRFGVNQRAALRAKGQSPHLLVMTATPIPRSLALTLYGDLDLSVLDEMPAGRMPIQTHIIHPIERSRAYSLIESEIEKNHQAYIIYPLVELDEDIEDENKAAVDEWQRLQQQIFPHLKIGLLHGRLNNEEKENALYNFRNKNYDILVSTSVVEVGVDIPNATVMMIEGANRFGLAQLHQFRGRVGRGSDQSYCLLLPENQDAIENERLTAMVETTDGFVLAEKDLEQRGPGDFLGTRQSGYNQLVLSNLMDVRLIEKARNQAVQIFATDPQMDSPEYKNLKEAFNRYWGKLKGESS